MVIDIPGYKIVRTLGRGGMASVYLAIQESFEREVALKVMNAALSEDPKFTARFLHEARVVSRLVHPNIVTVYDVGVQGNQHFLSMEYVPGMDLKHKRQFLTPPQSLQVIRDVAKALDYASKKGYVHRDVKPENIMLNDDDGRAVLMDFGIACLADSHSGMTQTGTAIGTPHYMSPEQAKGRPVDSRSDIYSLGVVLFMLLTGRVPYDADSAVAVGIKHVQEPVPRLPGYLLVLQPIINKVLSKDPRHRFQTGAELVAAIDAVTDEDIEAIQLATKHYASHFEAGDATAATLVGRKIGSAKGAADSAETAVANVALGPRRAARASASSAKVQREAAAGGPRARAGAESRSAGTNSRKTRETNHLGAASDPLPASEFELGDEILAVAEEDRRDYPLESEGKRRWPWALAAAVILAMSGGIYFRDQLPPPMAASVNALADKSEEIGNKLSAALGLRESGAAQAVITQSENPDPGEATGLSVASLPLQSQQRPPQSEPPGSAVEQVAVQPKAPEFEVDGKVSQPSGDSLTDNSSRDLREQLDEDLSVSPQLADLYRQTLAATPDDKKAQWGLRELLDYHYRYIRDALQARDLDRAQSYLSSLQASFPAGSGAVELAGEEQYQRLLERFEQAGKAQDYVAQGESYLAADALTEPPGANALEAFQRARDIDADNPEAAAGMGKIVDRYRVMAEAEMSKGSFEQAVAFADHGLNIDGGREKLTELRATARSELERQRNIERLTLAAQQQMDAENYMLPQGDSAYDYYKSVLEVDANNDQAIRGLARIEQRLVQITETHINRNQFDEARRVLLRAREAFANSQRLVSLGLVLEQAVEADFLSRQPQIPQVLVSSRAADSIRQAQAEILNVERTIHIGFSYRNFESKTSVVQAMLYDGSRSIQIAQVPVIVSGEAGVKFFQIDRPVEGFDEGGYTIDLILNDDRLGTLSFKVQRGQTEQSTQAGATAGAFTNNQAISQ